ncbi:hypothetical protein THAOC_03589 [Thalassiosira oceanica]|uniref:Uncharacterized protein n=1 Tax=Thalassiosira oceanica TaxID=159749 RepID=K0TPQ7_THAOC|nr:hypothetical protein THAOC_03589 [Thalassiosira oceanica]|eukprot:EJK74717.1 hypothetical protein THAOC_03589 [Thalassiosira oceanica]
MPSLVSGTSDNVNSGDEDEDQVMAIDNSGDDDADLGDHCTNGNQGAYWGGQSGVEDEVMDLNESGDENADMGDQCADGNQGAFWGWQSDDEDQGVADTDSVNQFNWEHVQNSADVDMIEYTGSVDILQTDAFRYSTFVFGGSNPARKVPEHKLVICSGPWRISVHQDMKDSILHAFASQSARHNVTMPACPNPNTMSKTPKNITGHDLYEVLVRAGIKNYPQQHHLTLYRFGQKERLENGLQLIHMMRDCDPSSVIKFDVGTYFYESDLYDCLGRKHFVQNEGRVGDNGSLLLGANLDLSGTKQGLGDQTRVDNFPVFVISQLLATNYLSPPIFGGWNAENCDGDIGSSWCLRSKNYCTHTHQVKEVTQVKFDRDLSSGASGNKFQHRLKSLETFHNCWNIGHPFRCEATFLLPPYHEFCNVNYLHNCPFIWQAIKKNLKMTYFISLPYEQVKLVMQSIFEYSKNNICFPSFMNPFGHRSNYTPTARQVNSFYMIANACGVWTEGFAGMFSKNFLDTRPTIGGSRTDCVDLNNCPVLWFAWNWMKFCHMQQFDMPDFVLRELRSRPLLQMGLDMEYKVNNRAKILIRTELSGTRMDWRKYPLLGYSAENRVKYGSGTNIFGAVDFFGAKSLVIDAQVRGWEDYLNREGAPQFHGTSRGEILGGVPGGFDIDETPGPTEGVAFDEGDGGFTGAHAEEKNDMLQLAKWFRGRKAGSDPNSEPTQWKLVRRNGARAAQADTKKKCVENAWRNANIGTNWRDIIQLSSMSSVFI